MVDRMLKPKQIQRFEYNIMTGDKEGLHTNMFKLLPYLTEIFKRKICNINYKGFRFFFVEVANRSLLN